MLVDLIDKLIDRLIEVAKWEKENRKNLFTDFIDPTFAEFEVVHKDYLNSFRHYRTLIGSSSGSLNSICDIIEEDSLFTVDRRVRLKELANAGSNTSTIRPFINSIIQYLTDPYDLMWEFISERQQLSDLDYKDITHLFRWDNIPGDDNELLIRFLIQKFGINWLKKANIEKTDDDRTIRVFDGRRLFSWNKIQENDGGGLKKFLKSLKWNITGDDSSQLLNFLKQNYGVEWVKDARIEKIDDGKTVKISKNENYLFLKINEEKTKVNIEIDDGRTDEFVVNVKNNKLGIYDGKNSLFLRLSDEKTKVNLEINDGRTDEFITKIKNDKLDICMISTVKVPSQYRQMMYLKNPSRSTLLYRFREKKKTKDEAIKILDMIVTQLQERYSNVVTEYAKLKKLLLM